MADFQARGVPPRVIRKDYHKPSPTTDRTAKVVEVEAVTCPTCGASGSDPCLTASGKVKSDYHSKREA